MIWLPHCCRKMHQKNAALLINCQHTSVLTAYLKSAYFLSYSPTTTTNPPTQTKKFVFGTTWRASVNVLFSNGTTINMQTLELDTYRQSYTLVHGDVVSKKPMPEDEPILQAILKDERKQRDRQCRNADIKPKKQSIKSQLEENRRLFTEHSGERINKSPHKRIQKSQEVL